MKTHECGATKSCKICGQDRPIDEYRSRIGERKDGSKKIWYEGKCKQCYRDIVNAYNKKNKDEVNTKSRESYQRTKEASLSRKSKYYKDNRDKYSVWRKKNAQDNREREHATAKRWRKNNLDKDCAKVARRNADKIQATPAWADKDKIDKIYKESARMTATGTPHHVDHFYPLKGKLVSGLHCEDNLRVITAEENVKKSNNVVDDIC